MLYIFISICNFFSVLIILFLCLKFTLQNGVFKPEMIGQDRENQPSRSQPSEIMRGK